MSAPKFNMLRACFYLLAVIIMMFAVNASIVMMGCAYIAIVGDWKVGTGCAERGVAQQAREILEIALTTVLALLLAAQKPPDDKDDSK